MNNNFNQKKIFIVGLILVAALSRLLPHPHNFTPITAMALMGAAYFKDKKWSIIVPLAGLWISDIFLNYFFYSAFVSGWKIWFGSPATYLFILIMVIAGWKIFKKVTASRVILASLGGSVLFFLVSNFSVWLTTITYPKNWIGLIECYIAGIPFFQNTLLGDLVYSIILFGVYEWAVNKRFLWSLQKA